MRYFAISLLSGRAPDAGLGATAAGAAGVDVSADINRRLDELNPHLTEAQISRIREAILRYSQKYSLDPRS